MDLDSLAVQVEGLLADQLGALGQIVPGLLFGGAAQISQSMLAEIVGKSPSFEIMIKISLPTPIYG